MSPSPANMVAEILKADFCAFNHRAFLELNPQTTFRPNWHVEVMSSALQRVAEGTCKRLIICLPPRHLKSLTASVALPAYYLGHFPSRTVLSVTYGQHLSDNFARSSRKLMSSNYYRALFKTRLHREATGEFETTEGGGRLSTSIGGAVTGRGADIIIVDDPIKAEDASSNVKRSFVNDWYDTTLRSRCLEDGAIVIVMQRLHDDDLVAHVQEHEDWELVSLPAIAERDTDYDISTRHFGRTQYHRKEDEVLHSALFSRQALESMRKQMKEYYFAAQYQQNPQPPSGFIVRSSWIHFYALEDRPTRFDLILQSWDTANKDSELANFSVCTTWGLYKGKMYLLDVYRRKLDFPELKKEVKRLALKHHASVVLIEDQASGTSLLQELRAERFTAARPAPALGGDKETKLRSQTTKIEEGLVLFPKEAPWLKDYLLELTTFPNSKNDDQVDSTVFALAWFAANPRWQGWTDESVEGLSNVFSRMAFEQWIRRF